MDRSIALAVDVDADPGPPDGRDTRPGWLVRMRVSAGFPFWEGSTWEWELAAAARAETGTGVLFRHYGFADGYAEIDLAHTAQTWALILQRLAGYLASGSPQPFFPAVA